MKLEALFDGYVSPWLKELLQPVYHKLHKKYGPPFAMGRNRVVYKSKFVVVKAPRNDEGLTDNTTEYHRFINNVNPELARARIIHINDIPVLVMQLIDTDIDFEDLPDWAGYYDSYQVGKSRKGQWKAYDYA